jgi:hypothetical protein
MGATASHDFPDHIQERACLRPQRAMAGMNQVQAAVERLGVQ